MRGLIGIAGLVILVAACNRPVPVALDAPPPYTTPPYQYPPPAPAMMQAPAPQPEAAVAEPASNATCFTGPGLPLCVPPDQIWHKSATEWYNPSTYCKWDRAQLPERLQKVCSELDQKYPPKKIVWKRFEADNGAAYVLDTNSISHLYNCGGCADAVICIVDNNQCIPPNMTRVRFDCHGHYMNIDGGGGLQMAPPRSVIGQMAAVACVGAKPN